MMMVHRCCSRLRGDDVPTCAVSNDLNTRHTGKHRDERCHIIRSEGAGHFLRTQGCASDLDVCGVVAVEFACNVTEGSVMEHQLVLQPRRGLASVDFVFKGRGTTLLDNQPIPRKQCGKLNSA